MARVQVHLFGAANIAVGAKLLHLRPNKRSQLLAYLAYRGDWVRREGLQYLFWSDSPPEVARGNLRQLLFRVSKMDIGKGLHIEHHRLRWEVKTDIADFKEALKREQWQAAMKHYNGPLLSGLEGDGVNEFANWLSLERERLHQAWRQALLNRAEVLLARASYLEAATLLKTLLEGDELDDEALKRYMQAMWQAGGRDQALKAYKDFAERLRQELDLAPTAELEQLARRIRTEEREGYLLVQPAIETEDIKTIGIETKLPTPVTHVLSGLALSFVGRDFELNDVTERLADPECRLLTLTGMGGVGKTSLAMRSAEQISSTYPQGVYFVALDSLNTASLIPSTIADSLKLSLQGQDEPLSQVISFIGEKELLLILDNYEHLLEGATIASALLRGCPKLKVLVTSRERLNLEEEWLLNLEGLSYPQDETLSVEESLYFDAVNLFIQRAQRVRFGFVPTQAELPYLLEICRLVEGSPLGLELAAVWVRLMPLQEIAQELSDNIDFLNSSSRNKAERHQSLRAVFENSWRLLTPKEQEVLRKLSVFVGGFSKEAAKQVTDASLPILATLVDKSLLRLSPSGRYDRHLLVYQYSREKLAEAPEEKQQSEAKHGAFYLGLVREQAGLFHTARRKAARQTLEQDYSNIRSAWDWALTEPHLEAIRQTAFALADFFEGRRHDGLETFARAAASLDEINPEHYAALGYMLLGQVSQQRALSYNPQKTKALSERAIALLRPLGDEGGLARGLWELADDEETTGNFARAQALLVDALALARRNGEPSLIGHILCLLALLERHISPFEKARSFMEAAFYELKELGSTNHQAYLLLIYGAYLVYENHLDKGETLLNESLRLSDALGGGQDFRTYILIDLARAAYKRAAFEQSEKLLQEAQREAKHRYHKNSEATALFLLGRVATARGAFAEARSYFARSLHIAWNDQLSLLVSAALVYLAELEAAQGQFALAVELLTLVQGQKALEKRDREEAQQFMAQLENQLSTEDFVQAQARGQALRLNKVVVSLLNPSSPRQIFPLEETSDLT